MICEFEKPINPISKHFLINETDETDRIEDLTATFDEQQRFGGVDNLIKMYQFREKINMVVLLIIPNTVSGLNKMASFAVTNRFCFEKCPTMPKRANTMSTDNKFLLKMFSGFLYTIRPMTEWQTYLAYHNNIPFIQ